MKGGHEEFMENPESRVGRRARRAAGTWEPLPRLMLTALEGVRLGWGDKAGRRFGEDTRSGHGMEPKEGSGYKSPAAVDTEAGRQPAEHTSQEQGEGGREGAERDSPAEAAWRRSVCKRGGETRGRAWLQGTPGRGSAETGGAWGLEKQGRCTKSLRRRLLTHLRGQHIRGAESHPL